jgi:flagellar motor switch protein FliN
MSDDDSAASLSDRPYYTYAASSSPSLPVYRELVPRGAKDARDVELTLTLEIGRARLPLAALEALAPGAVLELQPRTSDPVHIWVGETLVARGALVVVNGYFAVRVTAVVNNLRGEVTA